MPRRNDPHPFLAPFGEHVRRLRLARGMSLDKLAPRTGMLKGSLSSIELGRINVTMLTCLKIAKGLEVELGELFRFDGAASMSSKREG